MVRKQMFAISMLLALLLVVSIAMAITVPSPKTLTSAVLTVVTKDANVTAQATDSALVVSPAINTMQTLAKHTDSALTIDVMAISPHTPADFGHVVAFTHFDSALKKVQSAHTSMIMDSQVVAVSPPMVYGSFSFTSQAVVKKVSMVAADITPQLSEVVVVISNCGQIAGMVTTFKHTADLTGFAIAMA